MAVARMLTQEQRGAGETVWTVPENVSRLSVSMTGGSGGHGGDSVYNADGTPKDAGRSGLGGVLVGELAVEPGDILTLIGSDAGSAAQTERTSIGKGGQGWGVGGAGGLYASVFGRSGGGGGGASALLLNGELLAVAGGGGGGAGHGLANCSGGDGANAGLPASAWSSLCTGRGDPGSILSEGRNGTDGGKAVRASSGGGGGGAGAGFPGGAGGGGGKIGGGGGGGGAGGMNYIAPGQQFSSLESAHPGNGTVLLTYPTPIPVVLFAHVGTPKIPVGRETQITVEMAPKGAPGTFVFMNGDDFLGEVDAADRVEFPVSGLSLGEHTISVTYQPENGDFAQSVVEYLPSATSVELIVEPQPGTLNLEVSPVSAEDGIARAATVTATPTGADGLPVTGAIEIVTENRLLASAPLLRGGVSLDIQPDWIGSASVVARLVDSQETEAVSSEPVAVRVTKAATGVNLSQESETGAAGDTVELEATVSRTHDGEPITNGSVIVSRDGVRFEEALPLGDGGSVSFDVAVAAGESVDVEAEFLETARALGSRSDTLVIDREDEAGDGNGADGGAADGGTDSDADGDGDVDGGTDLDGGSDGDVDGGSDGDVDGAVDGGSDGDTDGGNGGGDGSADGVADGDVDSHDSADGGTGGLADGDTGGDTAGSAGRDNNGQGAGPGGNPGAKPGSLAKSGGPAAGPLVLSVLGALAILAGAVLLRRRARLG